MSEPVLTALRAATPQARITLLGGDFAANALPGRPGPVDEVVLVPLTLGVREVGRAAKSSWEDLRARHFDLALQLHGGGRNSSAALLARQAGFRASDASALNLDLWQHEVFRHPGAVAALGARAVRISPSCQVLNDDLVVPAELVADEPFVVIHPGATDPRRRWPAERFAAIADPVPGQVVVIGSQEEVGPVVAASRSAHGLPDTAFPALIRLIACARLFVGNDSGPHHLAEALGTPRVGLCSFSNMINSAPVTRQGHRRVISWAEVCPECGMALVGEPFPPNCCDIVSVVSDVLVEAVMSTVDELYEAANPRQFGV